MAWLSVRLSSRKMNGICSTKLLMQILMEFSPVRSGLKFLSLRLQHRMIMLSCLVVSTFKILLLWRREFLTFNTGIADLSKNLKYFVSNREVSMTRKRNSKKWQSKFWMLRLMTLRIMLKLKRKKKSLIKR